MVIERSPKADRGERRDWTIRWGRMAKKKPDEKQPKPRKTRDYSQRAHDTVREAEKRHAERHKDDN